MATAPRMVFLGFGKYVRADRIYALEPIVGDERGNGRRTLVWVEGMAERDGRLAHAGDDPGGDGRRAVSHAGSGRSRRRAPDQPQLFPDGA